MELKVLRLLHDADGTVSGLVGYWRPTGKFVVIKAKSVVLATGGVGKSWMYTSNSWESTGDGHAMALWAGADLIDMECVQFHPTGMVWPLSVRGILVTEGVRGDGGVLRNSEGTRFMFDYVPDMFRAETADSEDEADKWYDDHTAGRRPPELLPRDEVARSINSEVKAGRGSPHGGVFLDIATRRTAEDIRRRLPVDVPPVQGAGRRRHHRRGHGGRSDLPLHHGWRPGRRRHAPRPPCPGSSPRARWPEGCTAPTAWAATRSPTCWSSGAGPASAPPSSPRAASADVDARRGSDPGRPSTPPSPRSNARAARTPTTSNRTCRRRCRAWSASSAPAPSSRRPSASSRCSRSGRRTCRVKGGTTYNPGWNLATDLPVHAHRLPVHDHGRAQPQGEPGRPDPRRLPEGRSRDGQGQLRRAHRRPVVRPRGVGGTPSVRSITSQPEPVPVMPDDLRALLEEAL